MNIFEKAFWFGTITGKNPITWFLVGLIKGIWIPFVLWGVFCLLTGIPYWESLIGALRVGGGIVYDMITYPNLLCEIQCTGRAIVFGGPTDCGC